MAKYIPTMTQMLTYGAIALATIAVVNRSPVAGMVKPNP